MQDTVDRCSDTEPTSRAASYCFRRSGGQITPVLPRVYARNASRVRRAGGLAVTESAPSVAQRDTNGTLYMRQGTIRITTPDALSSAHLQALPYSSTSLQPSLGLYELHIPLDCRDISTVPADISVPRPEQGQHDL